MLEVTAENDRRNSIVTGVLTFFFFFSSRRRHTRCSRDWSSDVCSSDLVPEYHALLLFATLGMMLMVGGEDLMVVFLGLELMSVAVYALEIGRASCRERV